MCIFIGIENVTANALIELLEKRNEREVSFDMIVRYGTQVAHILEKNINEEPILLLSRKYQINMIEKYSDFFEADLSSGKQQVFFRLKGEDKQKIIESLTKSFRCTMSMQFLKAFMSVDALRELGIRVE